MPVLVLQVKVRVRELVGGYLRGLGRGGEGARCWTWRLGTSGGPGSRVVVSGRLQT